MTNVPRVCANCENPVTQENGLGVVYAFESISIKVHLHFECAVLWSLEFGIPATQMTRAALN
jgi:hypothetical protein